MRRRFTVVSTLSACILAGLIASEAKANAILGLQNVNGSPYVDLTSILNGSVSLATIVNGSPSAGSINVDNNVPGGITSLTLYYYGDTGPANDAGSTLDCQNFNFGSGQTTCSVYDPINGQSYDNGASTPPDLPQASYQFTWDFASTQTADFNIVWSSFSGTGYNGCIAGTPQCVPAALEPSAITLVGVVLMAFIALAGYSRRKSVAQS
jgi:hypothetical protein